jgi:hypothetical protein
MSRGIRQAPGPGRRLCRLVGRRPLGSSLSYHRRGAVNRRSALLVVFEGRHPRLRASQRRRSVLRMRHRRLLVVIASVVAVAVLLTVLNLFSYWQINSESGTFSMAPSLPPCNGHVLVEGFTYLFRNPHRGEVVMFRARGSIGTEIVPTSHGYNLQINKRVIGVPGDRSRQETTGLRQRSPCRQHSDGALCSRASRPRSVFRDG